MDSGTTYPKRVCDLLISKNSIQWRDIMIGSDAKLKHFLWFIHGEAFKGKIQTAFYKLNLQSICEDFNIFDYIPGGVVLPKITQRNEKPMAMSKFIKKEVSIIKANTLREFLELNYVPLGKDYKNANPCKENLDAWISSGRLDAFQTEYTRIAIQKLTLKELQYAEYDLSKEFGKTTHNMPMQKENSFGRLKHLISFGLSEIEKLEANGHTIPEEYELRSFLESELSKRQRTTTTSSSTQNTEENSFINILTQ